MREAGEAGTPLALTGRRRRPTITGVPRLPYSQPEPPAQPPPPAPAPEGQAGTADHGPASRDEPPLSVSQANAVIREVLSAALPQKFRVRGEVSNLSRRSAGGHWFFSIKDESATLRCVCFASHARRVSCEVDNGLEVVCTGRVDLYPAQGQVQLYVETIEPVGEGALEAELKRRIAALREKGWLDEARKRPLPGVPRRVAVVTSRAAAALQDVIHTTRQRWPGCELRLVDVPVQGASAAPKIAAALNALARYGGSQRIDAIVLTRGGGSLEDLWAFNEAAVAEAVYKCSIPVVAAIGHETDVTVAELVADRRASTPTQAAMLLVPDREALAQQFDHAAGRLRSALRRRVERLRDRLDRAARHRVFRSPRVLIDDRRQRLDRLAARLAATPGRELDRATRRLRAAERHLVAVDPARVVERGFTYTLDTEGRLLRTAAAARASASLTTVFHDGRVESVPGRGPAAPAPPAAKRSRSTPRNKRSAASQDSLFDG